MLAPAPAVPPKPTRLMVGLMILKHRFDLSDEEVVQGLHENVVWMVFCGVPPEEVHFIECEFRFNHRNEDLYKLILRLIWENPQQLA